MPPDVAGHARSRNLFIAGLGVGQICSWGSVYYAFPLLAEAMGRELGWSKPVLYGAASLGLLLAGAASYPVGAAIDRGHGRAIMAGASLAAGLLFFLWAATDSVGLFYVAATGLGCAQAALLYEPAFAVTARRFGPAEARNAITALTLFGGFASTVFIPLTQGLIDGFGWRGALVGLGAINLALCAGLYWAVIDPSRDRSPALATSSSQPRREGRAAVAWAARTPVFWALMASFVLYSLTFSAFTYHLYALLIERGLSASSVVAAMATIGPAQVAARVVVRVFAPRAPMRAVGSCIVGVFPLVLIGFFLAPPGFALLAGLAVAYGAANGVMTIVRGLAVPDMLTQEAYGAINGALNGPAQVVRAVAPAAAAALWTATHSYDGVLLALIAGALLMAGAFWIAALTARRPMLPPP